MVNGPLCGGCPLQHLGHGFGRVDGNGSSGVLLVGEALGKDESVVGLPFQGAAGKLLDRMLSRRKDPESLQPLSRDDFWIANVINCRPPDNLLTKAPYEMGAISHCSPYLKAVIAEKKPKAILAMGNQALRWFTGEWGIDDLRGYVFRTAYGPVVGTYHPAYIMRGKFPYVKVFQQDVLKALYVARYGIPEAVKDYSIHPSPNDAAEFLERYRSSVGPSGRPILSFDIETPYSKGVKDDKDTGSGGVDRFVEDDPSYRLILRISFSFEPFKSISMPWVRPYTEITKALLELSGDKLVWNKHFDVPRLRAQGIGFGGRIIDGMDAFHFLEPSLPMGLKYAATFYCPDMHAWKLDSREKPEWYNAADSDVALRVFLGTKKDLEAEGRWDVFIRHCVDLSVVLQRMSSRGVLVDKNERAARRAEFERELDSLRAQVQDVIPMEVKPKKVFKLSAERLKKEGKWTNTMVSVSRLEEVKPPKPAKPPKPPKPVRPPKEKSPKPRKKKESSEAPEGTEPSLSEVKKTRSRKKSAPAVEPTLAVCTESSLSLPLITNMGRQG